MAATLPAFGPAALTTMPASSRLAVVERDAGDPVAVALDAGDGRR